MVYPGDKRLKRKIIWRINKERFLNLLRRLVGKKAKEYSWETMDDYSDKDNSNKTV